MAKLIDITGKALSGEWGTDDETGDGIPVLRTTNFTNEGVVNYNDVVTRTITKKNIEEKFLRKGDIIIEKSGGSDKFPVGRVIYFDGDDNKYLFNNFTGLLRVKDQETWYPRYVFYSLFANYKRGGTRAFENKTTGLHNLKTDDYNTVFIAGEGLAASALYGTDTKVVLFEEGDYEVALDYEISDKRKILKRTDDYRISFKFSVRNGTTAVFIKDKKTNSELGNSSHTSDGFYLDYAGTKYMTVYITREKIHKNDFGKYSLDPRENIPAKDGNSYDTPGIYNIRIHNDATNEDVEKKIFVGSDKIIIAMAATGLSIDEISNKINT